MIGGAFFDDSAMYEPPGSEKLARISFESILKFLGRLYSDDPQKSLPFEKVFDVLGVRLSVRQLGKAGHSLMKKPARLQKLSQLLTAVSAKGRITKDEAQVVCGVLNFAMNFCMGHALKVAMRAFAAISVKPTNVMPSELAKLCSWTSDVIARLEPRTIPRAVELSPVLVFTDAAFEDQVASWGGVVVDKISGVRQVAGGIVPDELVKAWQGFGIEQVITQAQAFAALLARRAFQTNFRKRRALFFFNNEAARLATIKATSPSLSLLRMVHLFHMCAETDPALTWVERVGTHTHTNIADLPSRGKTLEVASSIGGEPTDVGHIVQQSVSAQSFLPCQLYCADVQCQLGNATPT